MELSASNLPCCWRSGGEGGRVSGEPGWEEKGKWGDDGEEERVRGWGLWGGRRDGRRVRLKEEGGKEGESDGDGERENGQGGKKKETG